MNKSTIIAIVVGIIIILAVIVGIGSMMSKPSSTTSTTQTPTTQATHTSQTTTSTTITSVQTTTQTTTQTETKPSPLVVSTINFNLGTITPNTGGSFTPPPILLTVNEGGNYTFYLVNTQELGKLFSNFYLTFVLSNSTMHNLYSLGGLTSLTNTNVSVYLSPGTYELSMELTYAVQSIVSPTSFNGTFLAIGNSSVKYAIANVIFNIQSQTKQLQLKTNPSAINFNLGILTPNASGKVHASTQIIINKGGYYSFYLTNAQELEKEFFGFSIIFTFINQTTAGLYAMGWLTPYGPFYDNVTVYLSPGVYELNISVVYTVSSIVAPATFNGTFLAFGNSTAMYELANASFTINSSNITQTSTSSTVMTQPINDAILPERNSYILLK